MSLDKRPIKLVLALATGALLIQPLPTLAFNFGDMMNPGKWMGGNRDRDDYYDDRDYDYGPNGYGLPLGPYGGNPYGGYGGYPYRGYGGYGGYAPWGAWAPPPAAPPSQVTTPAPAPAPAAAPAPVQDSKTKEIESLKRRIEELESRQAPPPAYTPPPPALERGGPASSPAAGLSNRGPQDSFSPSFRPMDKY